MATTYYIIATLSDAYNIGAVGTAPSTSDENKGCTALLAITFGCYLRNPDDNSSLMGSYSSNLLVKLLDLEERSLLNSYLAADGATYSYEILKKSGTNTWTTVSSGWNSSTLTYTASASGETIRVKCKITSTGDCYYLYNNGQEEIESDSSVEYIYSDEITASYLADSVTSLTTISTYTPSSTYNTYDTDGNATTINISASTITIKQEANIRSTVYDTLTYETPTITWMNKAGTFCSDLTASGGYVSYITCTVLNTQGYHYEYTSGYTENTNLRSTLVSGSCSFTLSLYSLIGDTQISCSRFTTVEDSLHRYIHSDMGNNVCDDVLEINAYNRGDTSKTSTDRVVVINTAIPSNYVIQLTVTNNLTANGGTALLSATGSHLATYTSGIVETISDIPEVTVKLSNPDRLTEGTRYTSSTTVSETITHSTMDTIPGLDTVAVTATNNSVSSTKIIEVFNYYWIEESIPAVTIASTDTDNIIPAGGETFTLTASYNSGYPYAQLKFSSGASLDSSVLSSSTIGYFTHKQRWSMDTCDTTLKYSFANSGTETQSVTVNSRGVVYGSTTLAGEMLYEDWFTFTEYSTYEDFHDTDSDVEDGTEEYYNFTLEANTYASLNVTSCSAGSISTTTLSAGAGYSHAISSSAAASGSNALLYYTSNASRAVTASVTAYSWSVNTAATNLGVTSIYSSGTATTYLTYNSLGTTSTALKTGTVTRTAVFVYSDSNGSVSNSKACTYTITRSANALTNTFVLAINAGSISCNQLSASATATTTTNTSSPSIKTLYRKWTSGSTDTTNLASSYSTYGSVSYSYSWSSSGSYINSITNSNSATTSVTPEVNSATSTRTAGTITRTVTGTFTANSTYGSGSFSSSSVSCSCTCTLDAGTNSDTITVTFGGSSTLHGDGTNTMYATVTSASGKNIKVTANSGLSVADSASGTYYAYRTITSGSTIYIKSNTLKTTNADETRTITCTTTAGNNSSGVYYEAASKTSSVTVRTYSLPITIEGYTADSSEYGYSTSANNVSYSFTRTSSLQTLTLNFRFGGSAYTTTAITSTYGLTQNDVADGMSLSTAGSTYYTPTLEIYPYVFENEELTITIPEISYNRIETSCTLKATYSLTYSKTFSSNISDNALSLYAWSYFSSRVLTSASLSSTYNSSTNTATKAEGPFIRTATSSGTSLLDTSSLGLSLGTATNLDGSYKYAPFRFSTTKTTQLLILYDPETTTARGITPELLSTITVLIYKYGSSTNVAEYTFDTSCVKSSEAISLTSGNYYIRVTLSSGSTDFGIANFNMDCLGDTYTGIGRILLTNMGLKIVGYIEQ